MTGNEVRITIEGLRIGGNTPRDQRSLILVHPPQHDLLEGFSSGLIALASHVTNVLPEVAIRLLDLGSERRDMLETRIKECIAAMTGHLFVGITTTTASYQAGIDVAAIFKALAPDSIVILGGHHASSQDDVILTNHRNTIDFVIRGEGEVALEELLRSFPYIKSVPNLSYRRGIDAITRNDDAPLLDQEALNRISVTFRGWGLRSAPGKFDHATYVSARGCPLKCAFCSVANQRVRYKSVDAVIRDLRVLVCEMGYQSVAIEDNFFAHSPSRTIELCEAIAELQREVTFRWDCQTRVESCQHEGVIVAMERAGCEAIYLGVESLDPELLLYLNKTRHPGNYLILLRDKVVPRLLRSQLECYINLQLGIPGEAGQHRQNTLRLLEQLGQQAEACGKVITVFPQLHVVYPGTAHFHLAQIEGRYGPNGHSIFEEFTRWESQRQPILRWLGEHFAHGTGGIPEGILNSDSLKRGRFNEDIDAIVEVINYLNAMANTPGISVFQYGRYLTGSRDNRGESITEAHT
ncbi:MAG: B12-binding domain-containing radical SAM protein [Phycisphaerales bacterium]|nr:B12-binding domain-containing radical SAM protein [Phycisphaerales bacterium]MCB9856971.1 B12-binding domain-containing radical SAM protein [Phycisphaerales bacterium]MCB9861902.1 B12-binding domain-containing radical SAM protein [Phycisphaerales bacterium]